LRSRGRQICACLNVTDAAIRQHLDGGAGNAAERLASLQSSLKCGTSCGSCVPELRQLVLATMAKAVAGHGAA
jgi:assimilatory nitrate reductase catalytic subunit